MSASSPTGGPPPYQPTQGEIQLSRQLNGLQQEVQTLKKTGQGNSPTSSQDAAKIEPSRPDPKPARVSLNGKQYQIIIKRPGSDNNKLSPAVAQKFATLFGTTLKYGLVALCHQHNLDEKEIKLKYVKIKKKLDGELFLTYKDKSNKYKIKITNYLSVKKSDKDEIVNKSPDEKRENVNTASKTFEKAIETFEASDAYADATNSSIIGIYDLNIDATCLSKKVKEFYDPKNKIDPKPLGSNSNKPPRKVSSEETETAEIKKTEKDSTEAEKKTGTASKEEEDQEIEEDSTNPTNKSEEKRTKSSSSESSSSAASTSPSKPAKATEATKPNEVDKPLVVSEEEKDISTIPFSSTDARTNSSWKNYLLKGTLGGEGRLPSHRTRTPRDVKPASFSKDEAAKIVTKIIENTAIGDFEDKEKVFLKRFLLQLLADNNSKKKVEGDPLKNCLKQRLDWTIAEFALPVPLYAFLSLDSKENKDKMCSALKETLQKIQEQTAS